ncbi:MAG TPA: cytidylate kinase-like family protein [Acidimicrobiia bacterium]|nr:cytidylate kinase-like family protein [Acidimicrobiia bacterium]
MSGTSGRSGTGAARVVTVSATYGAAGALIAPALATRLELPFADRLIPARSGAAAAPCGEQLSDEERLATRRTSFLDRLAHLTGGLGLPVPSGDDLRDHVREQVERSIHDIAAATGAGGVILGRAAMVVLADHPTAFHVRLDGPASRRCARAMALEGIDEATAADRMAETDRARDRYFTRIYGGDAADPALYHLVLDSTVLPVEVCVRLIADAANAFWGPR